MSAENKAIRASELSDNYDFGEQLAPENFDPDATSVEDIPDEGWYLVEVADFSISENEEHKWKGESWRGDKLGLVLRAVDGPHQGKCVRDYLPLPTAGSPMYVVDIANRWGNFIKSCGYQLPPGSLIPNGFQLHSILADRNGPKFWVQVYRDNYEGKSRMKVRLFGYRDKSFNPNGKPSEKRSTEAPAAAAAAPAAASKSGSSKKPAGIDLSEL